MTETKQRQTPTKTPETPKTTKRREGYPEETPETPLFTKWAQEITQFIEEIEQKRYSYNTETLSKPHRIETTRRHREKNKKWFRFSTQRIRRELARGLGNFYDIAITYAQNTELTLSEREKWGRLATYTAQTINAITTTYDDVRIEETLDELKQFVKNKNL